MERQSVSSVFTQEFVRSELYQVFLFQPRQTLLSAASQVGEASYRVLYTIGEEDTGDRERKDLVLGLAKTVANSTAALVLKAKNVASECDDQYNQNRVSYLGKSSQG